MRGGTNRIPNFGTTPNYYRPLCFTLCPIGESDADHDDECNLVFARSAARKVVETFEIKRIGLNYHFVSQHALGPYFLLDDSSYCIFDRYSIAFCTYLEMSHMCSKLDPFLPRCRKNAITLRLKDDQGIERKQTDEKIGRSVYVKMQIKLRYEQISQSKAYKKAYPTVCVCNTVRPSISIISNF